MRFRSLLKKHAADTTLADFKTDFGGSFHTKMLSTLAGVIHRATFDQAKQILTQVQTIYKARYPTIATRKTYESQLKKVLAAGVTDADKSTYIKTWYLKTLDEFNEHKAAAQGKVKKKNECLIVIERREAAALMTQFLADAVDADAADQLVAKVAVVQLAIGCRLIELLNPQVSKFRKARENVIQIGVAKTCSTGTTRTIIKTVYGTDSATVLKFIREIRRKVRTTGSNSDITGSVIHQLNSYISKHGSKIGIYSSHNLRALWVNLTYNQASDETLISYLGRALGHKVDTKLSDAATSYSWIKIVDKRSSVVKAATDCIAAHGTTTDKFNQLDEIKAKNNDILPSYRSLNKLGYSNYTIKKYIQNRSAADNSDDSASSS